MQITIVGYVTMIKTGVAKKSGNAYTMYNIVGPDGIGKSFFGGPLNEEKGIDQQALSVIGGLMHRLTCEFDLKEDGGLSLRSWEYYQE